MSRVASMPSRPGIRTSMSTTSGLSAEHIETAVAPSPASPATAISLSASRISRKPFLIRGWSRQQNGDHDAAAAPGRTGR